MHLKNLLFVLLLIISNTVSGQTIKSQTAFRLLQTANTLMEAQQLDAAEEYFKKGLAKARSYNDLYCQAYAHQGLGTLYNKLDQKERAIENYKNAISLYKIQGQKMIANVVESLLKSVQGIGDLYAGVEVGAKGIKLSIIDVKLSKDKEFDYTLISDSSINTDAASLSYQSEKETADAVAVLWNIIKNRYRIAPNRVHIVISSGLKQELDKYNKVDYFAREIRPKNLDSSVKIKYVTPNEEAELSLLGIVPQKHRFTTNQLDIGSGNTKGGYFNYNKVFVPITFPIGTKSFQRMLESRTNGSIEELVKTGEQLWKDSLARVVANEFLDKRDFKERGILYLSGGIVWAITSLTHPQNINDTYVEISSNDISEFRKTIVASYEKATQPDFKFVTNYTVAEASKKNISQVLKTFDRKALIAGSIWLDELVKQVNTANPDKKIIYPKYAFMGWISGYIIKKATRQYTGLAKL
jgi:tetratricopeptide (TPR) repeat protein